MVFIRKKELSYGAVYEMVRGVIPVGFFSFNPSLRQKKICQLSKIIEFKIL